MNSLKIKGSGQDSNFFDSVPQTEGNVNTKFSLSTDSEGSNRTYEQPSTFGTPLKEIALEQNVAPEQDIAPTQEDIAPVAENVAEKAPVAENATTTSEDMFPDGYAPATAEEVEALNKESFDSLGDADVSPKGFAPFC